MRYDLEPTRNIVGDVSGLLANFCDELIGAFYPKNISKKVNIVVTELFDNAVENSADDSSKLSLDLRIDGQQLRIQMKNAARRSQFRKVKAHINRINSADDLRELMSDTIRMRREGRLKGGLGLIRLAAENKFRLSVKYHRPYLILESWIPLGGSK